MIPILSSNEPDHEKMCRSPHANNKVSRFKLASVAEQAGLNLTWSQNPEDMFSHDVAQILICFSEHLNYNWAVTWQNQQNDLCTQQRLRSAWASAQSDPSLRCVLFWVAKDPMLLHVLYCLHCSCFCWRRCESGSLTVMRGSFRKLGENITLGNSISNRRKKVRSKWKKSWLMTKLTKWHVRQAKIQISLGICPVWSVFAVRMKKPCILSYPLSAQWRLIILGGCPDWSESLLGAQSFCWFCHEAAQNKNWTPEKNNLI